MYAFYIIFKFHIFRTTTTEYRATKLRSALEGVTWNFWVKETLSELQPFDSVRTSRCAFYRLTPFYSALPSFLRLHEYPEQDCKAVRHKCPIFVLLAWDNLLMGFVLRSAGLYHSVAWQLITNVCEGPPVSILSRIYRITRAVAFYDALQYHVPLYTAS